jgi:hypothetical protein
MTLVALCNRGAANPVLRPKQPAQPGGDMQIDCIDETPGRGTHLAARVSVPGLSIGAEALIRARVELEAERMLATHAQESQGFADWLVRPDAVETLLNGERGPFGPGTGAMTVVRRIDREQYREAMVATALKGFAQGRFLLFAGDRQVTALDEAIDLRRTGEVVFLRLLPLVGG